MRIVQIEKQRGWAGQVQQAFFTAKGLHQRGHKVLMVCQPNSNIGRNSEEIGIEVMYLPMIKWRLFTSALKLGLYLRKEKYDILHSHGSRDHLLSIIAHFISGSGKVLRSKHNIKKVKKGLLQYHYLTHKLSAVSKPAAATLEKAGVPGKKISLIYSSFDLARFSPHKPLSATLKELKVNDNDFVIGAMGRLVCPSKGMEVLLRAAPMILEKKPNARFLLAGRPGKKLPKLAEDLGISDKVIFPGFYNNTSELLSCIDLFVQPSITEALSSSIIQAMAMQRPVVASNTGGIPEVVKNGKTGILFETGSPEALAQTVLNLTGNEKTLLEMGEAGRKRALEIFTLDRMIDEIEAWYATALET